MIYRYTVADYPFDLLCVGPATNISTGKVFWRQSNPNLFQCSIAFGGKAIHISIAVMRHICDGNRRGGKILINGSFCYEKNKERNDVIHWRCWRKTCLEILHTIVFDVQDRNARIYVNYVSEQNHTGDDDLIATSNFTNRVIDQISDDPSVTTKCVYSATVAHHLQGGGDRESITDFNQLNTVMKRKRQSLLPHIPLVIEDVRIEGQWAQTWSEEEFLLDLDNDLGVAVFGTTENLIRLSAMTFSSMEHALHHIRKL